MQMLERFWILRGTCNCVLPAISPMSLRVQPERPLGGSSFLDTLAVFPGVSQGIEQTAFLERIQRLG